MKHPIKKASPLRRARIIKAARLRNMRAAYIAFGLVLAAAFVWMVFAYPVWIIGGRRGWW
jgi:hypothetical protein